MFNTDKCDNILWFLELSAILAAYLGSLGDELPRWPMVAVCHDRTGEPHESKAETESAHDRAKAANYGHEWSEITVRVQILPRDVGADFRGFFREEIEKH